MAFWKYDLFYWCSHTRGHSLQCNNCCFTKFAYPEKFGENDIANNLPVYLIQGPCNAVIGLISAFLCVNWIEATFGWCLGYVLRNPCLRMTRRMSTLWIACKHMLSIAYKVRCSITAPPASLTSSIDHLRFTVCPCAQCVYVTMRPSWSMRKRLLSGAFCVGWY